MNQLLFEKSVSGRRAVTLDPLDVELYVLSDAYQRQTKPRLAEIAEVDLVRHYMELSRKSFGVDNGFYPLGSCTMKYNPKLNEFTAALAGFTDIHPLAPDQSVQGAIKLMDELEASLSEITGMDGFTLQPAAGAQGEFTGLLTIRAYLESQGYSHKTKVIVPDSAHGTNPASAAMAGYTVVSVPSNAQGGVDVEALKSVLDDEVAALMLTNPNTLGLFDPHILEISELVHQVHGLLYYDGANLNAIMGKARPGDMGFDVVHLNLHKTFSTPHGGGGPGSGPVGCKKELMAYLPQRSFDSKTRVRSFYGNFLVNVRAYTYILALGKEGLKEASEQAVLNANYLMHRLKDHFTVSYPQACMHEFVLSLESFKTETGVSAKDICKALLDEGIHPPTMYFPLVVHEALMIEPTETESKETLDQFVETLLKLKQQAKTDPQWILDAPHTMPITRVDDVLAARQPILTYPFK